MRNFLKKLNKNSKHSGKAPLLAEAEQYNHQTKFPEHASSPPPKKQREGVGSGNTNCGTAISDCEVSSFAMSVRCGRADLCYAQP